MDEKRGPLRKREEPHHGSPRFQESRLEHAAAPVLAAFSAMPCSDSGLHAARVYEPRIDDRNAYRRNLVHHADPAYTCLKMNEFVSSILNLSGAHEEWRPISRWAVGAWLTFYLLFLVYAFQMHGGYLFIDSANLVVHEGGHLLFGWFGSTIGLWGGTILQ